MIQSTKPTPESELENLDTYNELMSKIKDALKLQEELQNTENKISFSRQFYNDSVTMYNTKLEVVPSNIIASMFGFEEWKMFEAQAGAEVAPVVQF